MATINDSDLGDTYWCTSADVQDEFQLEIGNSTPDFEERIKQATRLMQARWGDATGKEVTDANLPNTVPDLLQDATAYKAASLAHVAYAQNISGSNNDDQRHVFLDQQADEAFDAWKTVEDLDVEDESDHEASETVSGVSGVIGGKDNSPIYRGG